MNLVGWSRYELEQKRLDLKQRQAECLRLRDESARQVTSCKAELDRLHREGDRYLKQERRMFGVVRAGVGTVLGGLVLTVANGWFATVTGLGVVGIVGGILAMRWFSGRERKVSREADQAVSMRDGHASRVEYMSRQLRTLEVQSTQLEEALRMAPPEASDPLAMARKLSERGTGILEQGSSVLVGTSRLKVRDGTIAPVT